MNWWRLEFWFGCLSLIGFMHLTVPNLILDFDFTHDFGYGSIVQAGGNPFKLNGPAFLVFYWSSLVLLIAFIWHFNRQRYYDYDLKHANRTNPDQLDILSLGYLAGGASRAVDIAITGLVSKGFLRVTEYTNLTATHSHSGKAKCNELEALILGEVQQEARLQQLTKKNQINTNRLDKLRSRISEKAKDGFKEQLQQLQQKQLICTKNSLFFVKLLQLACSLIYTMGVVRFFLSFYEDPLFFLIFLVFSIPLSVILTSLLTSIPMQISLFANVPTQVVKHLTEHPPNFLGRQILEQAKQRQRQMKHAKNEHDELLFAVALGGMMALKSTVLADLAHAERSLLAGPGGGSSGGGGCGGGGCGGGCGG
ncbi:MAG: TIGR04222 domain-containing membrane protein [Candidatus Competibacterales bacterium]